MSSVSEILEHASRLDLGERAELISSLLEDLDPLPHQVSDADALRRRDELVSGEVSGLSEEEFWQACGRK